MQYSDNTVANLLMRLLGGPAGVTAFARSIGDGSFRLDRWEPGLERSGAGGRAGYDDTGRHAAGPAGNLLSQAERATLLGWMRDSRTGLARIRSTVPTGVDRGG